MNTAGLILNIVGTLLIWWFGVPASLGRDGRIKIMDVWGGEASEPMKDTARKVACGRRLSNLGMLLLFLGFVLQLVALHMAHE